LLGENSPGVVRALEPIEKSPGAKTEQKMSQSAIAEAAEKSLGVEVEQAQEAIEKSPVSSKPPSGDRIPRSGICTRSR
jgi:hypothetical protein